MVGLVVCPSTETARATTGRPSRRRTRKRRLTGRGTMSFFAFSGTGGPLKVTCFEGQMATIGTWRLHVPRLFPLAKAAGVTIRPEEIVHLAERGVVPARRRQTRFAATQRVVVVENIPAMPAFSVTSRRARRVMLLVPVDTVVRMGRGAFLDT